MLSFRTRIAVGYVVAAALGLVIAAASVYLLRTSLNREEAALARTSESLIETHRLIGAIEQMTSAHRAVLLGVSSGDEGTAEIASAHHRFRTRLRAVRARSYGTDPALLDGVERSEAAWYALLRVSVAAAVSGPRASTADALDLQREVLRAHRVLVASLDDLVRQSSTMLDHARAGSQAAAQRSTLAIAVVAALALALTLVLGLLFTRTLSELYRRAQEFGARAEFERNRLESVLMALPVPVARYRGPDHVLELANPSYAELFGARELVGRRMREGQPELAAQGCGELFDRAYRDGAAQLAREVALAEAGGANAARWLTLTLQPQRGIDGAVEGLLAVAVDVTELVEARKAAEGAAWRAERLKRLAAALSRSATVDELSAVMLDYGLDALRADAGFVGVIGADGRLDVLRERGLAPGALERWRREQVSGAVPVLDALARRELVLIESRAQLAERYPEAARHSPDFEAAAAIPLPVETGRAGVIWMAFGAPRQFGERDREFLDALGRQCAQGLERAEVYEKERAARADAEKAVRVRDEFLSIASHELKTPVTSLQLQVQRLARASRSASPDVRLLGALQNAERSIARLGRLVDNLLDVSHLSSDCMSLELEEVDLGQSLRDVAERLEGELARSGSDLVVRGRAPVVGRWDRMRIEQIAANLLSNAIKFGAGRPIEIDVEAQEGTAVLTVRDGGLGIPPEDQQRIFKRLERAVSPRHYGGFGLGLWIARKSAEAMGGTIRVQSAPGFGSSFAVELPLEGPGSGLGSQGR